jgi:hypothetical protein
VSLARLHAGTATLKSAFPGTDGETVECAAPDSATTPTLTPPVSGEAVAANGGFPEPPDGGSVRVVRATHDACGGETRVRLPRVLAAGVVHRVVCAVCAGDYEVGAIEEVAPAPVALTGAPTIAAAIAAAQATDPVISPAPSRRFALPRLSLPTVSMPSLKMPHLPALSLPAFSLPSGPQVSAPRLPSMPSLPRLPGSLGDPSSPVRRYGMLALGALAVLAILVALQGGGTSDAPVAETATAPADAQPKGNGKGAEDGSANFVRESTYSLALPDGWKRTASAGGATFAAAAASGEADATLWIERDSGLDFPTFEARSLGQLRSLAGSAHVVERVAAPTADDTVIRLAAAAPEDTPRYEVTLRASGPYRYYLATTLQPGASKAASDAVDLVHGSFTPAGAAAAEQASGSAGKGGG